MRNDNLRLPRLIALCVLAAAGFLSFPGAGIAQTTTAGNTLLVQPGDTLQNIVLVEESGGVSKTGFGGVAVVTLSAAGDNLVQLNASAGFVFGRSTAHASAVMWKNFCVPNRNSIGCFDGTSDEDLTATVSFDVQRIWRFFTLASGTTRFGINFQITDLDDNNRVVAHQVLEDASQGSFLGKIVTIAKVPAQLPQFAGSEAVQRLVFTARLRRAHHHRFEMRVFAAANSGIRPLAAAHTIADDSIPFLAAAGVQVINFDITVSPSATDQIADAVADLQDRVAALEKLVPETAASNEGRAAGLDERLDTLNEGVSEVTLDVEDLKAANQATQAAVAGVQTRVGTLETQVGTLQIRFDGHTHDCVLLRPADDADDDDRRGAAKRKGDDDRRSFGRRFTISCGAPTLPATQASVK